MKGKMGGKKKTRQGRKPSETMSTEFASLFRVTAALGRKLIASRWDMWEDGGGREAQRKMRQVTLSFSSR